jgi:hypothetical protein
VDTGLALPAVQILEKLQEQRDSVNCALQEVSTEMLVPSIVLCRIGIEPGNGET